MFHLATLGFASETTMLKMPSWVNASTTCAAGLCDKPSQKYERIADVQPGTQWMDAGGYCGSWATQRAVLAKGAWLSQQVVRDHTEGCGGHDEEILSCNIDEAWTNLKIDYNRFDFETEPLPQTQAYFKWLKAQLAAGHTVAWMLMWSGQSYPIYNLKPPSGMYGHVEPVIGIQSDHPLNDTTVYDDDTVVHYTDSGTSTVYRKISTLPCEWSKVGDKAKCGLYSYGLGNPYGFGWAAKGFTPDVKSAIAAPASLHVDPWKKEPDTRSGETPEALQGTLTATELEAGVAYDVYRWDSVGEAFSYRDAYKKASFTATSDSYTYTDDSSFQSNGATYYRVVRAA